MQLMAEVATKLIEILPNVRTICSNQLQNRTQLFALLFCE